MAVQITGRQIANAAVNVSKLDLSTGTFDFQSAVLQVATPSSDNQAASKAYVDGIAQGIHWKDSARIATTANITLSGTQTIDGVAISADQRVLVKNQTSGAENGLYLCKAGAWARTSDMNEGDEFSGSAVFIREGSTFADTGFVCTNDGSVTVGTTAITFVQFTGAGQVEAGAALTKTGNRLDVATDDSSLEVSSDALRVKAGGISNAMLAGSIEASKLAGSIPSDKLNLGNGVQDNGGNLQVKLDGSTLGLSSSGIKVADGAIGSTQLSDDAITSAKVADGAIITALLADSVVTAQKLAGSIPSDKLNLGNGVQDNGGNLQVKLDGSTLGLSSSGIKVADGAIGSTQLSDDAITNAKVADGAIRTENLNFESVFQAFDANGSTLKFDLSHAVPLDFKELFVVTVNGLIMEYKDSPDAQDNYKIANDGSGSVGAVTFGSNLSNGDRVTVRFFKNK